MKRHETEATNRKAGGMSPEFGKKMSAAIDAHEELEQLIEAYCGALDTFACAEDECEQDDASCALADARSELNGKKGEAVACDVTWPGGKVTSQAGTLLSVDGDDAFIENDLGNLVGDVRSLVPA